MTADISAGLCLGTEIMRKIKILDTTLRDGEQSPGCSMNLREKTEVASYLEKLRVDIIEAGFAVSSPGDFEAVKAIAETVKDCTVASLARAAKKDIEVAYEAVKGTVSPRIHVFIATSPLHMQYKLKMTEEQVLERIRDSVKYASSLCSDVQFSMEDATRSDKEFLVRAADIAVANGAKVIGIPDTVGYATCEEMKAFAEYLRTHMQKEVDIAVHCHNDLGMAVANSLAGIEGGAVQVDCTVNGIGERAGNTSLEEIVMAIDTRGDFLGVYTDIDTKKIFRTSKKVYDIIGQTAPINKPIVGKNAFAHESGIHQHGVLENKKTYEIMTPESVGIKANEIILGKHSGRHAFEQHLSEMGHELTQEEAERVFEEYKKLCDKKKEVNDFDIEALISQKTEDEARYTLDRFDVHAGNHTTATSTMRLKRDGDTVIEDVCLGDGPVDAAYNAIDKIISPPEHTLDMYNIRAVSEGKDTLGEVLVKLRTKDNKIYNGRGLSTDIIEASILAYLNAVNKLPGVAK